MHVFAPVLYRGMAALCDALIRIRRPRMFPRLLFYKLRLTDASMPHVSVCERERARTREREKRERERVGERERELETETHMFISLKWVWKQQHFPYG
jgi:hypothetical protein